VTTRPRISSAPEFDELNADVSPNGRWVAYESSRRGTREVHVSPFPDASTGLTPISSGGGKWPLSARDGRTLFYGNGANQLVSVEVERR
jgi:hypothetical protein